MKDTEADTDYHGSDIAAHVGVMCQAATSHMPQATVITGVIELN